MIHKILILMHKILITMLKIRINIWFNIRYWVKWKKMMKKGKNYIVSFNNKIEKFWNNLKKNILQINLCYN